MDPLSFDYAVGSQGVSVYVQNMPWIKGWLTCRVLIRVGARHDRSGKEGEAHFLEHMPFQGCEGWTSEEAVRNANDEIFAGSLNAHTGFESTVFEGDILTENLADGMRLLGQLIFHPLLEEKEVKNERRVIIQEIWESLRSSKNTELLRRMREPLYGLHPMGRMLRPFGCGETVQAITENDLGGFHQQYYHLGNMVLIFAGNINLAAALEATKIFAKQGPVQPPNTSNTPPTNWPPPSPAPYEVSQQEWFGVKEKQAEFTSIQCCRLLTRRANNKALVLFGKLVGRLLLQQVRGKLGATYGGRFSHDDFSDHHFCLGEIKVPPEKEGPVRQIIADAISYLASGQGKELFCRLKNRDLKNWVIGNIGVGKRADQAAACLIMENRVVTDAEWYSRLEAVEYEDIRELAANELSPNNLYWVVIRP